MLCIRKNLFVFYFLQTFNLALYVDLWSFISRRSYHCNFFLHVFFISAGFYSAWRGIGNFLNGKVSRNFETISITIIRFSFFPVRLNFRFLLSMCLTSQQHFLLIDLIHDDVTRASKWGLVVKCDERSRVFWLRFDCFYSTAFCMPVLPFLFTKMFVTTKPRVHLLECSLSCT